MTGCHAHASHSEKKLRAALMLTLGFMAVEVAGGVLSGSLALMADAVHMMTDALALGLALAATRWARRPADARRSFGYGRAETLAGYTNAVLMAGVVVWIVVESVHRLIVPPVVDAPLMLGVSIAGLAVNALVLFILSRGNGQAHHGCHHAHDVNVRGALLHVAGDFFGSLAAILSAILILTMGWSIADPVTSLLVAGLVAVSTVRLMRETGHILLEGVPSRLTPDDIRQTVLTGVPEVTDVHHVHLWALTPDYVLATLHGRLRESVPADGVSARIKAVLRETHGVRHVTVELETGLCADAGLDCDHV
jgi:cobalt-zinc-cadmium efflux system protein